MERTKEEQDREQQYLLAMHLMKQMKKEGIIDRDDLIEAEKAIKERFHPYWHYMWFDLEEK